MGGGLFPPQSSSSRAWAMKRRREEKGFPSSLWDPPDRIPNEPRARGGAKGPKPQGFLLLSFSCRCTQLLLLLLRRRRPSADRRSAMKGKREKSERPISPFYLPLLLSRAQSLPRPAQAQASSDREQDPVYFLRSIYSYRFYSRPATCGILALHVTLHAVFCGFLFLPCFLPHSYSVLVTAAASFRGGPWASPTSFAPFSLSAAVSRPCTPFSPEPKARGRHRELAEGRLALNGVAAESENSHLIVAVSLSRHSTHSDLRCLSSSLIPPPFLEQRPRRLVSSPPWMYPMGGQWRAL